ncbi:hypothetical protein DXG01_015430 [Tephrocybe rancida]|nr:hypothetical protein DXG01_015430 [Tephrocybe rancida]
MVQAGAILMRNYAAGPGFLEGVEWKCRNNADILVEVDPSVTAPADAVCIVTGEVAESLPTAKHQLTLVCPNNSTFAPDWRTAVQNFAALQDKVSTGTDKRYFLIQVDSGGQTDMRMSSPIAEPRAKHLIAEAMLDQDTAQVSVPAEHQAAFDKFKLTHKVLPLRVYDTNDEPVLPEEVASKLKGALVEVYILMKHYYMGGGEVKFNTFMATIEQIIILRAALPKLPSPYRNPGRKGPFRPRRVESAAQKEGPKLLPSAQIDAGGPSTRSGGLRKNKPEDEGQGGSAQGRSEQKRRKVD